MSSSLKREVRFTIFDCINLNKTAVTVLEATFKQFYDRQNLFVHAIVHKSISEMEASKYIRLLKLKKKTNTYYV